MNGKINWHSYCQGIKCLHVEKAGHEIVAGKIAGQAGLEHRGIAQVRVGRTETGITTE